jgi:hypothetical protein
MAQGTLAERIAEQRARQAGQPWPPKAAEPMPTWLARMREGKLPAKSTSPGAIPTYTVGEDRHNG